MASQLNSDDLRNVGQAFVKHNSLDVLLTMKLVLSWNVFLWSVFAEFEWRKNIYSKFSSRFDTEILGVHPRVEVAEGRRALRRQELRLNNASAALLALLCQ